MKEKLTKLINVKSIDTDSVNAKPTLDISVKIEE